MTEDKVHERAMRILKLIKDLDAWIRALRKAVPARQPWQRSLLALLDDADRQMQILLMTEAMQKPDHVIVGATIDLDSACQKLSRATQGSRADALVKSSVKAIAQMSDSLRRLALEATHIDPQGQQNRV